MEINYKILSIILGILLVISVYYTIQKPNSKNSMGNRYSDINQAKSRMHMMPDGSMMSNTNPDMHSMMMDMTARMQGKSGDELDKIFLEDMIIHHQGAVDMAKELQKGTQRPELQKMATDIINVQTAEIAMMQNWLTQWFSTKNTQ
jgi:uncharacterized protein (DUF305 family)